MNSRKIKLFTIGYSDNASTSYILDYLISHGVVIDKKNQNARFCTGTEENI